MTTDSAVALQFILNSLNCIPAPRKPYSHFIRGIIAGYLTAVLGVKMKVEEIKCTAKGDPNCIFEAKPEN